MQIVCPTSDRLREFLEGTLEPSLADEVAAHVNECATCDRALSSLESEQSDVVSVLRERAFAATFLNEPEFAQLKNTVRIGNADTTPTADVGEQSETGKRLRDYRLVRKIGEGGMGTVYQAVHVHLAKPVALKILPSDKLQSKQSVKRFRQEMRAVGRVNHPNVVSASDAGTIDGQHFLVMELVQGADLARIINDQGSLAIADACEIVRQAATGLQHAHDNGLVHRDVKPSNVMLTIDGNVKLLDLGLASLNKTDFETSANIVVSDGLTSVGQIMGTLDYMAPEQITASPDVDGQADVYALGATLFQLLTCRTPCGDRSDGTPQRIDAVLNEPPLDIRSLRNDVPDELRKLLFRMLAKNPEDRPQTASDVANEIESFTAAADLAALAEECRTSLDIPSADVDVTDDASFLVSRTIAPEKQETKRLPLTAKVFFGTCLTMLAAAAFFIVTNNGVVKVEVLDDRFTVAIDGRTMTIAEDGSSQPTTLRVGDHKLVVSIGDTKLIAKDFEITRNDNVVLRVERLNGAVIVSRDGEHIASDPVVSVLTPRAEDATTDANNISLIEDIMAGNSSDLSGEPAVFESKKDAEMAKSQMEWMFENSPELRQQVADRLIADGRLEEAKKILDVGRRDPEATASMKLAESLEKSGDLQKATGAYLDAFRIDPRLLDRKQFEVFKKAQRMPELAQVFTKDNLKKLQWYNISRHLVKELLEEESTRAEGYELLERVWATMEREHNSLLGNLPELYWKEAPDLIYYARLKFLPEDIAAEGAGWERFTIESHNDLDGSGYGSLTNMKPLYHDKAMLRQLAGEVVAAINKHDGWKAGLALMSVLKAEMGDYKEAAVWLNKVLANVDQHPIPSNSAWIVGLALEGKDPELDKLVVRLYEMSIRDRDGDFWPLRISPLTNLADLYAKADRKQQARELLYRLADQDYDSAKTGIICVDARSQANAHRCTECHRQEKSLLDVIAMSNKLTDIGNPVDALVSLARVDRSFRNVYASDAEWVKKIAPADLDHEYYQRYFREAQLKAESTLTAQAVLTALDHGVFNRRSNGAPSGDDDIAGSGQMDLMIGVRGENGEATVFSPVIDLLTLAADSRGENASKELAKLDARLRLLFEVNFGDVEAAVASTVIAFLRNDLQVAEKRLKKLQAIEVSSDVCADRANATLWLAARYALQYEQTGSVGAALAERVIAAAETLPDSHLKEAILRERSEIRESIKVTRARELVKDYGDVTPETIIAALDDGRFAYPLDKNHPESKQPSSWGGPIRLRTTVRGEGDQATLYSPVLDLLSVVARPGGAVTEEGILELDKKLVELWDQRGLGYGRVEAGVAATVFAFQRGDIESAMKRVGGLKFYGNYFRGKGGTPFDLNLWLAIRHALDLKPTDVPVDTHRQEPEETIAVAKDLDEYAVRAARKSDDPQLEQALLRERSKLLQSDRLELAKAAFARGDREEAREILRTVPGVGSAGPFILYDIPRFDSDAAVAFKLAELLEEESDWTNAADAYLEAYRGEIRLLAEDQVAVFRQCGRTTEFVDTLIEEHVVRVDGGYLPIKVAQSLLEDENTLADGDRLLKHLWASPESILVSRLLGEKEIWKLVPDLSYYLRKTLLPADIESEGAGWARFDVRATNEYSIERPASGFPLGLEPFLQEKAVLREVSEEVAVLIKQHPDWKAGAAVMAFLEAEIGDYPQATEWIQKVLADAETRPIPSDSAWILGMALEGRDDELDRHVMRLYESSLRNRPERISRVSAIPKLAQLNVKFDQLPEARQLLHRMEKVDYDPRSGSPICVYGRSVSRSRCNDCHSGKSNFFDVCLMSEMLNEFGYPVDSLISLASIDASFGNAYGSDDAWAKKTTPEDFYSGYGYGRGKFVGAKTEAENAITPQVVLEALQSGVFSGRDMTKPEPKNAELAFELNMSVRGVDGKSALFSPSVEVLELAAKAKGDEAAIANAQIDQLLSAAFHRNPDDLGVGIAATVFALLRNDLNSARERLKKLEALSHTSNGKPDQANAALWLVARHAIRNERTRIIGAILAERALDAAETQNDSSLREAILYERSRIQID